MKNATKKTKLHAIDTTRELSFHDHLERETTELTIELCALALMIEGGVSSQAECYLPLTHMVERIRERASELGVYVDSARTSAAKERAS